MQNVPALKTNGFGRCLCFLLTCWLVALTQAATFYGITDKLMGEYQGTWATQDGRKGRVIAQIRPISNNRYDGFVLFQRQKARVAAAKLVPAAEAEANATRFISESTKREDGGELFGALTVTSQLQAGKLTGQFKGELGEGNFEALLVDRKPKTLGARPLRGAIPLFDGKNAKGWETFNWRITPDGAMEAGPSDIRTTDKYANYKLHIEFRTPYMPTALGQERGNSGVYLQSKYEIQILDSFGLYPLKKDDCGALYGVREPEPNACLPPMSWQTLDITYIQGNQKAGELPSVTVLQNGVTILDDVDIPGEVVEPGTGGGDKEGGFLRLQAHGAPVQFRNIWVQPFFATEKKR